MAQKVKFATKIDGKVLKELRTYSEESMINISDVVNEAVAQYLQNVSIRPAFKSAAAQVIAENEQLLRALAK